MGQDEDYPLPNFSAFTDKEFAPLYPGAVFSPTGVVNQYVDVQDNHHEIARTIARDAITLLKNDDDLLPLDRNASLRVFGTDAGTNPDGINSCSDKGCNKGVLTMGWGSGSANLPYLVTPEEAIRANAQNAEFYITDKFPRDIDVTPDDVAIVFLSADSGENYITVKGNPGDRTVAGLHAWYGGDKLVQDAAEKFSNVVVVVHTVGPIILEDWIGLPSVKSVLFAHLPGQEAGNAVTDILFGDYAPSGHLPYTIPRSEGDYPESVDLIYGALGQVQDTFTEGLYIDYRHFQGAGKTPRYPFGHGLSYTTFNMTEPSISPVSPLTSYPPSRNPKGPTPSYPDEIPPGSEVAWPDKFNRIWRYLYPYLDKPEDIKPNPDDRYPYPPGYSTEPQPDPRAGGAQGGNPALWDTAFDVSVRITNTGDVAGRAVAQFYVELPADHAPNTPRLQLRQFEKTKLLQPGESEVVKVSLTRKDVSVWDVVVQDWKAPEEGRGVKVWIGESVEDLKAACSGYGGCRDA